ncbi:unnamed protein product [Arabis nemorensis]|uniref:Uncharacterized protein n=1 Tax=Arabis nemorensis TaxID=586526 RepID=A0A565BGU0_9BRAS|nr:unnamed protein product [Arabis nemorensis]
MIDIAVLSWQMKEEELYQFLMNELVSQKDLMDDIRDQMFHYICWVYAASDLVSGMRRIRKWETKFIPLCTWYLSTFCDPSSLRTYHSKHSCYPSTVEIALKYIEAHGIPKELLAEFDCKDLEPPSVDEALMMLRSIKGVRRIETIEEALIYYGFKTNKNAFFKGYYYVVMLVVVKVGEEVMVVCISQIRI